LQGIDHPSYSQLLNACERTAYENENENSLGLDGRAGSRRIQSRHDGEQDAYGYDDWPGGSRRWVDRWLWATNEQQPASGDLVTHEVGHLRAMGLHRLRACEKR
jgi:hypothetical protein